MDSQSCEVEDRRVPLFNSHSETWWMSLEDEGFMGVSAIAYGLEQLFDDFDQHGAMVSPMRLALASREDFEAGHQWVIHRQYSIEIHDTNHSSEPMVEGVMRLDHDPDPDGGFELFCYADGDDVPLLAIAAAQVATEIHKDQVHLFIYNHQATEIFLLINDQVVEQQPTSINN